MRFIAAAETDIGIVKKINQDSLLLCHGRAEGREVLLAAVCDGMGGLPRGELASAAAVRAFRRWFDEELPPEPAQADMQAIGARWVLMLKRLNARISDCSKRKGIEGMGTTFSGILFMDGRYLIVHVGDSRIYQLGRSVQRLTEDHTVVSREVSQGLLSPETARTDRRRSLLWQCVGASPVVEPQIIWGSAQPGQYLLCSDGLYHEVGEEEMKERLAPDRLQSKKELQEGLRGVMELAKKRGERDNISGILIQAK